MKLYEIFRLIKMNGFVRKIHWNKWKDSHGIPEILDESFFRINS